MFCLRRERLNINLTVFRLLKSKVNLKVNVNVKVDVKGNLPMQKMLYASLGCYILLRTYVPT